MKLDRNISANGRGKYALLKLRRQDKPISQENMNRATHLRHAGLVDFGTKPGDQFFVIKYRDKFAAPAMIAYAAAVRSEITRLNNAARLVTTSPSDREDITVQAAELAEYARDIEAEASKIVAQHARGDVKIPD